MEMYRYAKTAKTVWSRWLSRPQLYRTGYVHIGSGSECVGLEKFFFECNSRHIENVCLVGDGIDPMSTDLTDRVSERLQSRFNVTVLSTCQNIVANLDYIDNVSLLTTRQRPYCYHQLFGGTQPNIDVLLDKLNNKLKSASVILPSTLDIIELNKIVNTLHSCDFDKINLYESSRMMCANRLNTIKHILGINKHDMVDGISVMKTKDNIITYWDGYYKYISTTSLINGIIQYNYYPFFLI